MAAKREIGIALSLPNVHGEWPALPRLDSTEAGRIQAIVDHMLTLAALENRKQLADLVALPVSRIINQVMEDQRPLLRREIFFPQFGRPVESRKPALYSWARGADCDPRADFVARRDLTPF